MSGDPHEPVHGEAARSGGDRRTAESVDRGRLAAGVVGVGSMGIHHARVFAELPDVELVGVADDDVDAARSAANQFDTVPTDLDHLLETADVVSIAVPTRYHYEVASEAIERGVDVLIEKPMVHAPDEGQKLIDLAAERSVTLQVGHVERFNPAIDVLEDVLADRDVVALAARRLGPPVDRELRDDVVLDLMIHDVDVATYLVDAPIVGVSAVGTANDDYVDAQLEFEDGTVCSLTASRVTQDRIRDLAVTARDCHVAVDYVDRSIEVHRHSDPRYRVEDGDLAYSHESVIERPAVDGDEPLKRELRSFVAAAREGHEPRVTGADGLRAVTIADEIGDVATSRAIGRREVKTSDLGRS